MTYTINHFARPAGAEKNTTRFVGTFDKYDDAKARFDRIVAQVTERTKKQYHKWTELKWHKEPSFDVPDFFQVWDDKGKRDPYLEDTTIETVLLEARR